MALEITKEQAALLNELKSCHPMPKKYKSENHTTVDKEISNALKNKMSWSQIRKHFHVGNARIMRIVSEIKKGMYN